MWVCARVAVCAAALSVALPAGTGVASTPQSSRTYECQHPTTTGEEAYDLHDISPSTACHAVRALAAWMTKGHNRSHLYICKRSHPFEAGTPVLTLHHFEGYGLRTTRSGEFEMYKGRRSFAVRGWNFPLACW